MPLVDLYVTPREPARLDGINSCCLPTISRGAHELLIVCGEARAARSGSPGGERELTPTALPDPTDAQMQPLPEDRVVGRPHERPGLALGLSRSQGSRRRPTVPGRGVCRGCRAMLGRTAIELGGHAADGLTASSCPANLGEPTRDGGSCTGKLAGCHRPPGTTGEQLPVARLRARQIGACRRSGRVPGRHLFTREPCESQQFAADRD